MDLNEFADVLLKVGARHGERDRDYLKSAHDAIAGLVDGMHCKAEDNSPSEPQDVPPGPGHQEDDPCYGPQGLDVGKRGARHAQVDLTRIKKVHDTLCELGAPCPGKDA